MNIQDRVAVVTGGASGIGRAMARRFKEEGAKGVVVADLQEASLREVADEIGGLAVICDVTNEAHIGRLVAAAEDAYGRPIDIFCSNAGIARMGGEDTPTADWQQCWGRPRHGACLCRTGRRTGHG